MKELIKTLNTPGLDNCFSNLTSSSTPLALATVIQAVSPTSGKPGDKALVSADSIVEGWIGGGCAQPAVIKAARQALDSGQSRVIRVGPKGDWTSLDGVIDYASGCLSGGTLMIFIEPMIKQPSLKILGDSPVARSLSYLATHLGFSVTVANPDFNPAMYPDSISLEQNFSVLDDELVIIATQGKHDLKALKAAINSNATYIAMVASAKKIAGLKASLAKSGTEAVAAGRIHSPAGIEIGAKTPAEIALSILAELVRLRRAGSNETFIEEKAVVSDEIATDGGCCSGQE